MTGTLTSKWNSLLRHLKYHIFYISKQTYIIKHILWSPDINESKNSHHTTPHDFSCLLWNSTLFFSRNCALYCYLLQFFHVTILVSCNRVIYSNRASPQQFVKVFFRALKLTHLNPHVLISVLFRIGHTNLYLFFLLSRIEAHSGIKALAAVRSHAAGGAVGLSFTWGRANS